MHTPRQQMPTKENRPRSGAAVTRNPQPATRNLQPAARSPHEPSSAHRPIRRDNPRMSNTPATPSAPSHGPGRNPDSLLTPAPAGARRSDDTAAPPHQGLPPVWREDARILLLGSFPGNASLAARAYYAHPRNQFWPIMGRLTGEPTAELPYEARLALLRRHRIALWDTVGRCHRQGSLDSAIREALGNEFQPLLARLPHLQLIGFNGQHAGRQQAFFQSLGYQTVVLPSTSPAYASLNLDQKSERWLSALHPFLSP